MKKLPDFDTFVDFMFNKYERDEDSTYWDFCFDDSISFESVINPDGTLNITQFAIFMHQQDRIYFLKLLRAYHVWLSKRLK